MVGGNLMRALRVCIDLPQTLASYRSRHTGEEC